MSVSPWKRLPRSIGDRTSKNAIKNRKRKKASHLKRPARAVSEGYQPHQQAYLGAIPFECRKGRLKCFYKISKILFKIYSSHVFKTLSSIGAINFKMKIKALISTGLMYFFSNVLHSEMPEKLIGTWKLDHLGTSELYRNSPTWNEQKEKALSKIIDYIRRYTFVIKENKIERHFYREILTWDLNLTEKDSSVFTFNSQNKEGKKEEVQITKMGADLIHIKIGTENRYRLCAWRKQAPRINREPIAPPSLEQILEKMIKKEGRATKAI